MWTINNLMLACTAVVIISSVGQAIRRHRPHRNRLIVIGAGLALSVAAAWLLVPAYAGYIGFAGVALLYFIPLMLSRSLARANTARDWRKAQKIARWIGWLYPAGAAWRDAARLYQALELHEQERYGEAEAILQQLKSSKHAQISTSARQHLHSIYGRWDELLLELQPAPDGAVPLYLRCLAETGDLNGLVAAFQRYLPALQKLDDFQQRYAYLILFVFVGRPDLVQRVIDPIRQLFSPLTVRSLEATAQRVAGNPLPLQALFESFNPSTYPPFRAVLERRLTNPPPSPTTLSAENKARLAEIEQNWGGYIGPAQGQRFAFGKRS
jgi:hypothetical protein